jgi:hypothetical protein
VRRFPAVVLVGLLCSAFLWSLHKRHKKRESVERARRRGGAHVGSHSRRALRPRQEELTASGQVARLLNARPVGTLAQAGAGGALRGRRARGGEARRLLRIEQRRRAWGERASHAGTPVRGSGLCRAAAAAAGRGLQTRRPLIQRSVGPGQDGRPGASAAHRLGSRMRRRVGAASTSARERGGSSRCPARRCGGP